MRDRRWWVLAGSLVLLALVASANGISNDFTYDDRYIVLMNEHVRSLHEWWRIFGSSYWPRVWGSDGYRPLTILFFALEWAVGGGAPWVFHAVNILTYCAATVSVFWLGSLLIPEAGAWIAAALFAVHPVHVEAVANVVGQSEIVVALCLVTAVALYVRGRRRGDLSLGSMAAIGALYLAACLTKENGMVLPALLVLAEATVIQDERPLRRRLFVVLRPFGLFLVLLAAAFLLARSRVLVDDLAGFQPYIVFQTLRLTNVQRVLTMLGVVPSWIRLLLWPAHLSVEYSPPYVDVAQGLEMVQLPGLLLLLSVLGIAVALWRRKPLVTFAVGWVIITLLPASNFIIAAGIILAERTLFLPSVGAMFLVGALVPWVQNVLASRRLQQAGMAAMGGVLALGAWRSVDRTKIWRDNDHLFRQAVLDAPLSYRAHYVLGGWLFAEKRKREGEVEIRRALRLFPYDPFMSFNLADQYRQAGMCQVALPLYEWSYALAPEMRHGRPQYAICLIESGNYYAARQQLYEAISEGAATVKQVRPILAAADSGIATLVRQRRAAASASGSPAVHQAGKLPRTLQNTGASGGTAAGHDASNHLR